MWKWNWSQRGNAGPAGMSPAAQQQGEMRTVGGKRARGEGLWRKNAEELGYMGNIHSVRGVDRRSMTSRESCGNGVDETEKEGLGFHAKMSLRGFFIFILTHFYYIAVFINQSKRISKSVKTYIEISLYSYQNFLKLVCIHIKIP